MSQRERRQSILKLLATLDTPKTVSEIAGMLYFSESSVRRDIRTLEALGLVTHLWGGVMLTSERGNIIPVSVRDNENSAVKEEIAKNASELVKEGDTILMDASSTVRRMMHYLTERLQQLSIVTNNRRIFDETLPRTFHLYCTGGRYRQENHDFCGSGAENYLRTVHADWAFFSSQGLSEDGEISDTSEEETSFRRVMLTRADKKVFLCDSSKIGLTKQFVLCNLTQVDEVICDNPKKIDTIRKRAEK